LTKAGYPQPKDEVVGVSYQLSVVSCIGIDIDYIEPAVGKKWIQETKELSAMLVGLSKSLRKIN